MSSSTASTSPIPIRLGTWAAQSLLWHFAAMWLLMLNGLAYLAYGLITGRLRERLTPIRPRDLLHTVQRHAPLQNRP